MNKKIKVVELLNKIANEEEMPKKLKFDDTIWIYNPDRYDYIDTGDDIKLFAELIVVFSKGWLNQEVEILEDNTEEIEELEYEESKMYCDTQLIESTKTAKQEDIIDKINQLVKAVNEIRKDLNK